MAPKIVVLALVVSICKVQSQSIGCLSNSQPSNIQSSSRPQTQTIQLQSSNSNKGLTASPQLQIVPNQNCNLQAIPLSQILSQSNLQRSQSVGSTSPGCGQRQGLQVTSIPQIPSSTAQCNQQPSCPTVISAPVSTITIPPSGCTTIIDNSLSNSLANALQMMIANDFINSAVSNNIINADCLSIPVIETSVPTLDLSGILKGLNGNQDCQSQSGQSSSSCQSSQSSSSSYQSDNPSCYDWKQLLDRLRDDTTTASQTPCSDWSAVLSYLDSQNDKYESNVEIEPENSNYDYSSFIDYLKQKGQTITQLSNRPSYQPSCQASCQSQTYNIQGSSSQTDQETALLEALAAYLGCSPSQVSSNSYSSPSVAEVVFPEEIPAQLICNYGYVPTSVPVVSFSVQPIGDTSNFIVGTQC